MTFDEWWKTTGKLLPDATANPKGWTYPPAEYVSKFAWYAGREAQREADAAFVESCRLRVEFPEDAKYMADELRKECIGE